MSAPPPVRRPTLVSRVVLVTSAVVVIAAVVTAIVAAGLIRTAAQREARLALARQADVVVELMNAGQTQDPEGALKALRTQATPVALVRADGQLRGDAVPRIAIRDRVNALMAGQDQSFEATVGEREVIVEARPLAAGGGVVLARSVTAAVGPTFALFRRGLLAVAIGLVTAAIASIWLARWFAGPLRRTASAAKQLAAGDRDIRITPSGPHEVAQVAESVNVLAAALQTSEARQRDFLLSVSHELRTPLTAIRGFSESLADGVVTDPDDVREAGRTMTAESQRLERLVGDLLDLARLGAEDFRLDMDDLDLTDVVAGAARVWQSRCEAVGVVFAAELPTTPLRIRTDPARLRQIIDGLAENALRVTPAGQRLVIALHQRGARAVIEVRDGGPGLTPDDRAVAFDRAVLYERYRGVRKVGTGLGLALVKALTERLGGQVEVGTAREGGASFRIYLKVHPAAYVPGQQAARRPA